MIMFYTDNGLLLARSCREAEDMIWSVVEVAERCGLKINKGKSNVLVYNCRGEASGEDGGNGSSHSPMEKVLLFEGRAEERVEKLTKILEEREEEEEEERAERGRLIESGEVSVQRERGECFAE